MVTLGEPYIYHDLGVIYKNEGISVKKSPLTIKKLSKKRRNERKLGEITEDYYFKETVSTDSYTVSRVVVSREWWRRGGFPCLITSPCLIYPNKLIFLQKESKYAPSVIVGFAKKCY